MFLTQALILGIIQGLGEFLPISSSGHLAILPWLFNFTDQGQTFDVALHIGTLTALIIYFRSDIKYLIKGFLSTFIKNIRVDKNDQKLAWLIIIATIPAAIAGYFGESIFETVFRHPISIALALIIMGLYLGYAEKKGTKKTTGIKQINLKQAVFIGIYQCLALMPGVSRSGITITAGLLKGLSKETAARFSFLLSAPIIFGAGLVKTKEIIQMPANMLPPFIIGIITSALVGYLAIKFLLSYIKTHTFKIFIYYRILLGLLILTLYFLQVNKLS